MKNFIVRRECSKLTVPTERFTLPTGDVVVGVTLRHPSVIRIAAPSNDEALAPRIKVQLYARDISLVFEDDLTDKERGGALGEFFRKIGWWLGKIKVPGEGVRPA